MRLLNQINYSTIYVAIFWTVIISMGTALHISEVYNNMIELARIQANQSFEKDLIYRQWVADHGVVYVPSNGKKSIDSNFLHMEKIETMTAQGVELTRVNPASMTRQVHEIGRKKFGHQSHITSLKPIRAENAPDDWETKALLSFEQGIKEAVELTHIGDKEYLRLMRPLLTKSACLSCHKKQGYKKDDIRGGISVSIPMQPIWDRTYQHIVSIIIGYFIILLLGLIGIVYGTYRLKQQSAARREAEVALNESKKKYQALYNKAPLAYQSLDNEHCIKDINHAWLKTFGYTREEVIGKRFEEFLHPHSAELYRSSFAEMNSSDNSRHAQYQLRHKQGHYIDVSFEESNEFTNNGMLKQSYGVLQDISKRLKSESLTREKEQQVSDLLNSTAEGIIGVDLQGNCTFANPAFAQLFDYSKVDDFVGNNIHQMLHYKREDGTPYPEKECPMSQALSKGKACHIESEMLWRADGSGFLAEYWSHPIYRDGKVSGSVVAFLDVTKRIEHEKSTIIQAHRAEALLKLPKVAETFDEMYFIQYALDLAENLTQSNISLIHFIDKNKKPIEAAIWSNRTFSEYHHVDYDKNDLINEAGIWADVLNKEQSLICNEKINYTLKYGLPEGRTELRRLIILPIFENDSIVMLMVVGNKHDTGK